MKKFFKSCICVIAVLICGLVFVGCKDKNENGNNNNTAKKDVSISISSNDTAIAYGTLPEISAAATYNGNVVTGTIVWDAGQIVTIDKSEYSWTFTPEDTNNYNVKKGTKTLSVQKAIPTANLEVDVDRDGNLDNNTLAFSYNGHIANGTINWQNIDLKTIAVGAQKEVSFEFISSDPNFENIVDGIAKITPKYKPTTTSIPSTIDIGANANDLAMVIGKSFKYGKAPVNGTCTLILPTLVAGNNTANLTFVPEDTAHYLSINSTFSVVAFKRDNNTYLVENANQLLALSKGFSSQSFKLANDIDFSDIDITSLEVSVGSIPHYVANKGTFRGSLDGNGFKIYGINNTDNNIRFALFNNLELDYEPISDPNDIEQAKNNAMIRNLVIEASGEVAITANVKTSNNYVIIFSNVTVNGSVNSAKNCYAPFVTSIDGSTMLYLIGCTNNYTISGLGTASAFVGAVKSGNILVNNCTNNANIFAANVGMFLAEGYENAFVRILGNNEGTDKCTNNATLKGTLSVSLWGVSNTDTTDENFNNTNGSFEVVSPKISSNFDDGYLKVNILNNQTSTVKIYVKIEGKKNNGAFSTFYEEIASENSQSVISFENIILASAQRKKALDGTKLLSYSQDNNGMWIVDFDAIKGISENINANAEWSINNNISIVAVAYDASGNMLDISAAESLIFE